MPQLMLNGSIVPSTSRLLIEGLLDFVIFLWRHFRFDKQQPLRDSQSQNFKIPQSQNLLFNSRYLHCFIYF